MRYRSLYTAFKIQGTRLTGIGCPEDGHLIGVSNTVLGYFTRCRLPQVGQHYSGGDIVVSIGEKGSPKWGEEESIPLVTD